MMMKKFLAVTALAGAMVSTVGVVALAQMPMNSGMDHAAHHGQMMQGSAEATLPGQDAFGALQEIITILQADPKTDWSRVNITGLRNHLVDMNRLVLDSAVVETPVEGGLKMVVSGQGRTLQAIQAMVPAHAPMLDGLNDWTAIASLTADGAVLTVTTNNAADVARVRGLGFYGLMASGAHHQAHHLGMARGEAVHKH